MKAEGRTDAVTRGQGDTGSLRVDGEILFAASPRLPIPASLPSPVPHPSAFILS